MTEWMKPGNRVRNTSSGEFFEVGVVGTYGAELIEEDTRISVYVPEVAYKWFELDKLRKEKVG
jgi:hypothetical protein